MSDNNTVVVSIGSSRLLGAALLACAALAFAACGASDAGDADGASGTNGAFGGAGASGTGASGTAGDGANLAGSDGTGLGASGSGAAGEGPGGAAGAGAGGGTAGVSGDGASGAGGSAGSLAGTGAAGMDLPADCDKGTTTGSQVVMIGDSYLALTGDITNTLQGLARSAGALGAIDNYRTYYVSGTSMGNGQIPGQFDNALAVSKDIKYVLMDGGGNDILLLNSMCLNLADPGSNASCKASVEKSAAVSRTLLQKMADSGVQQVVWFSYPTLIAGGIAGTMPANINNYAFPIFQELCDTAPVECHYIDTRPAFDGKQSQYIGFDHVHPTLAGSKVIAELMWDVMQQYCVAQ